MEFFKINNGLIYALNKEKQLLYYLQSNGLVWHKSTWNLSDFISEKNKPNLRKLTNNQLRKAEIQGYSLEMVFN